MLEEFQPEMRLFLKFIYGQAENLRTAFLFM